MKKECQHFLECIETGQTPESNGLEALRVVQILEAANESLKDGGGRVILENLNNTEEIKQMAMN